MRRLADRAVELLCMLVTCAALGVDLVACTAAQRAHAATALEAADVGCELAQLVRGDDGRLQAVCLGVDGARRVLERLERGAGGEAGAAGAAGGALEGEGGEGGSR
jgi:hypothetical protein